MKFDKKAEVFNNILLRVLKKHGHQTMSYQLRCMWDIALWVSVLGKQKSVNEFSVFERDLTNDSGSYSESDFHQVNERNYNKGEK